MKKLNEKGMCYASGYLGTRSEELYNEGFMSNYDRDAFREEYEGKRAAIEETRKWLFEHREGITDDSVDDYEAHMEHLTMMAKKSTMFKDGYIEGFREPLIKSLSEIILEFLCKTRKSNPRIAGYLRIARALDCIKFRMISDSSI